MIKNEIKTKKYLFKNDFDVIKGFHEFLHELNKSLVFKLSKIYESSTLEVLDELDNKMLVEKTVLKRKYSIWLRNIIINNYIAAYGSEEISFLELDETIRKIREIEEVRTEICDIIYYL